MRVAAIDSGTNTIRLLIADVVDDAGAPALRYVKRESRIVRLGYGVDRTGRFDPEALERTLGAVRDYAAAIGEAAADRIRFVATSATRDASNRQVFVDGVREALGVDPEVVSGDEEAGLSYRGALSALSADAPRPALVVDLGGGSTELVVGRAEPEQAYSMDIGSVRITERRLHDSPPTPAQLAEAREDIRQALAEAQRTVDLSRAATVVGVAGTITTITAHLLRLPAYDSQVIDGSVGTIAQHIAAAAELTAMSRDEALVLPYLEPGRADVIGAGALIWAEVLEAVRAARAGAGAPEPTVVTSEHDILDGIALSLTAAG